LEAEAELASADDKKVKGKIKLTDRGGGVEVSVDIKGATPGKHGFHIHEKGDCSDIPGKSMGGHFNPELAEHMLPSEEGRHHLGDLGNIELGPDSEVETKLTIKGATLEPGKANSLLGKAFVLHAGEDHGRDRQPAGDSGTPIACGVITTHSRSKHLPGF
jgi:Cu-Zn family superoxide dismutase